METKKRALGRGLEQLFNSENLDFNSFEKQIYETTNSDEIIELNLDEIRPNPYQPRTTFNEESLRELAESIKINGVFQPIIVKKGIKGYDLVAGERRLRASKMAGKFSISAIIRDFSDQQMMEIALLENLQRENLNVIEEARAYETMIKKLNLTQDELSNKVSKSRSHVTNILGLLRLPQEIQQMLIENKLTMGHARVLSKLESEEKMLEYAQMIVNNKIPVREIEEITVKDERKNKIKKATDDRGYKYVEELLREKLDTKVKIKENANATAKNNRKPLHTRFSVFIFPPPRNLRTITSLFRIITSF